MSRLNKNNISRGINYLKRNGIEKSVYKVFERLERDTDEKNYDSIMRANKASEEELNIQRDVKFARPYKISVLIPVYETEPVLLEETLESVAKQSYGNWELCIADASKNDDRRNLVHQFCEKWKLKCTDDYGDVYSKVKYKYLDNNQGISGNTNEALSMAEGDYIALLDHDDLIEPNALYMFMKCIEEKETSIRDGELNLSRVYMIYSDEDKIDENNTRYFDYHKKPDFDPILIRTNNYICHFLLVDANLARSVGGFHSEYDGAQDHDFILRCAEGIQPEQIMHLPYVLYHWRSSAGSTAENPNAKLYAYDAGRRAVEDHCKRVGLKVTVSNTAHLGFYHVQYESYPRSVYEMTFDEYKKLNADRLKLISQEYIMILSENLKPCANNYIEVMLSCMRNGNIGAVTGKIISKSGRIESAGYDKIQDGTINPRFSGLNRHFSGYLHRADLQQIVGAFNPECVLMRKSAVCFNDNQIGVKQGFDIYYEPEVVFKRRIL